MPEKINVAYAKVPVETTDADGNRLRFEEGDKLDLEHFDQDQLQALFDAGSVELREEAKSTKAAAGKEKEEPTPPATGTTAAPATGETASGPGSGAASKTAKAGEAGKATGGSTK